MDEPTTYLTAPQAAKLLGVRLNNLRQLQFRGSINWHHMVGNKIMYEERVILDYAAQRAARQAAAAARKETP